MRIIFVIILFGISVPYIKAQVYSENNGEVIFAFSNVEYLGQSVPSKMRFSLFLHLGQNLHYDFTDKMGFYTGYGIRNIGLITEDDNIQTRRRTYSLGIPLAFKAGSFNDHLYFYGGGECELFFHYKQKQFIDGDKIKQSEWFSNRTNRFAPSLFTGIQFPGGINLKFKYYPGNFLNRNFTGRDFGGPLVNYSDLNKTRLFYFSLSFNFKNEDLKKIYNPPAKTAIFISL